MGSVRTIKGVDQKTWQEFKKIASKRGLSMSEAFSEMIKEYSDNSEDFWDEILNRKGSLSDKEAKEMQDSVKELRKDMGFRE